MTDTTKDQFASQWSDLKDSVKELAKTSAQLGSETIALAKDTVKARSAQAMDYTRDNPGKALGMAAATGALAVLLLRRGR